MPAQPGRPAPAPAKPGPPSQNAPPTQPAPPPSAPVAVASVPAAETYPVSAWTLAKAPSGFVDSIELEGAPLDLKEAKLLVPADVLTVTGWAGDRALGIRFPAVVLSLCGRVVASTDVGLPRPDVAKAVHPNLGKAGWSARLLVGHLPRCADEKLSGWAVAPFGPVLFPLSGEAKLDLPPAAPLPPGLNVQTHKLVRPDDRPAEPQPVKIEVKGAVNVRECGSTKCKVVGKLDEGSHLGGLLDQVDGWALVVVPEQATGWLAERVVTMEPVKRDSGG